jgi:hypothetical protein
MDPLGSAPSTCRMSKIAPSLRFDAGAARLLSGSGWDEGRTAGLFSHGEKQPSDSDQNGKEAEKVRASAVQIHYGEISNAYWIFVDISLMTL